MIPDYEYSGNINPDKLLCLKKMPGLNRLPCIIISKFTIWEKPLITRKKINYNEALESFSKSIEFNPLNYPAFNYKGILLNDLKRYNEEIEFFDQAI